MRSAFYSFALLAFGVTVAGCAGSQSTRSGGPLPFHDLASSGEAGPHALHPFVPLAITDEGSIALLDAAKLGKGVVARIADVPVPKTAVFDKQGNLYVATQNYVNVYSSKKLRLLQEITAGINGAVAIVLDSKNNIYVVNQANNTITVYPPGASTPTQTIGGLNVPSALVLDSAGNLYVLNKGALGGTGNVSVYAPGGSSPMTTITSGIDVPAALLIGRENTLYVANSGNNTVSEYAFGSTNPERTIENVTYPSALALDHKGALYVANQSGGVVTVYKSKSTRVARTLTGVDGPNGIAIDESANVFVSTFGKKVVEYQASSESNEAPTKIVKLGNDAQPIAASLGPASADYPDGNSLPHKLAAPQPQQLFAADSNGNRILVFNLPFGPSPPPAEIITNGISNPNLVAFDSFDNLFTDNQGVNATLLEFTPPYDGSPANSVPLPGILEGFQFDQQNNLYISSCYQGFVAVIPPPYTATLALVSNGLMEARAIGITPSGNLLAANWCEAYYGTPGNGAINEYQAPVSSASSPIATLPPGAWPQPILVDPQGNVFVAYCSDDQCTSSYISIYSPPYGSGSVTTLTAGVNNPTAMLLDPSGNLYVANTGQDQDMNATGWVSIYTPPFTSSSSPAATMTTQIDVPSGLAMSQAGNLYVLNRPSSQSPFLGNYLLEFTPPFTNSSSPSSYAGGLSGPATQQIAIPPGSGSDSIVRARRFTSR